MKIAAVAFLACLFVTFASPAMAQRFVFGRATAGATGISPDHVYDGRYGFESSQPHLFSVAVPPGNYRVTVTLGDPARTSVTTIKAESRRLMLDAIAVPRGSRVERSFVVNVRDTSLPPPPAGAPGATAVRLNPREAGSFTWDDRLTLEILGDRAAVTAITVTPVQVPTLFLLGDSTVTDQRSEPAAGWGQMLPAFLGPGIAVANHAESGETLKSFLTGLRLDKILATVRPGDIALIQFGHNDQKAAWPQTHAPAATTYRDYLRTYIAEFRRRGVQPILVTSPERRNWNGTRIRPTLSDYAAAARAVAVQEHIPLIDLNAASIGFYEALGPDRAPLAFDDGGRDATHHNDYGAWVLAWAVAEAPALAAFRAPGLASFDPARPPAPETFHLEPSVAHGDQPPAGN